MMTLAKFELRNKGNTVLKQQLMSYKLIVNVFG